METHLKNPELKEVSLGKNKSRKLRDYDHVILQTFNIFSGFLADLVLRATNEIYNIASRTAQSLKFSIRKRAQNPDSARW